MISPGGKALLCAMALLLAVPACAEKTVRLQYRFPPGYEGHYRWEIEATRSIESPTEKTMTRLEAVLEMQERVRRSPEGRMILAVRLRPLSVKEDGALGPVLPPSTAEYEIDRQGRVRRLVKAGLSAGAISSLELDTLASQVRPPLTAGPVSLGSKWQAPLKVSGQRTSIDFGGSGRLSGFDLKDRRRLGRIDIRRRGSIRTSQVMNNAPVVLKGTSSSRGVSEVDIDHGVLFSSDETTRSQFDVLLSGQPAAKLEVSLTSKLQLKPRKGP